MTTWSKLTRDLDRLNNVLKPVTRIDRERWRSSRIARAMGRLVALYERFSDDGQVLVTITCVAGAIAIDVRRTDVYLAWATLVSFLFASFVVSYAFGLRDVDVDVSLPRHVTAGEELVFAVRVKNGHVRAHEGILVRGPHLSWGASWITRRASLRTLRKGDAAHIELRARFRSRGEQIIDPFRLQELAPFGLALGPARVSERSRLLVVPRIASVAALPMPVGRRHQPGGIPRASRTADSRELVGVRPYRIGDPVRDLHARSWARVGEPMVREHREEYFSRVGVVLDTELERAGDDASFETAVLVAGIIERLTRTEALIDVIVLGDVSHEMTLGRHLASLDRALELLALVDPGGVFDERALTDRLAPHLARLSSVVFVALRWDDARRAFARAIEASGTACVPFVVAEGVAPSEMPQPHFVSQAAIASGQEVTA